MLNDSKSEEKMVSGGNSALILVDIQHDFLSPDGTLAVPNADEIMPTAYGLLDIPWKTVIASQDFHPPGHLSFASTHNAQPFTQLKIQSPDDQSKTDTIDLWPDHCVQGTIGSRLDPGVQERLDSLKSLGMEVKVIQKGTESDVDHYSAFKSDDDTQLDEYLNSLGVRNLFCIGLAGDYCVRATVESGLKRGYGVYWISSGIRSVAGMEAQIHLERSLSSAWSSSSSFTVLDDLESVKSLLH
ncbi:hypothetical protein MJO28_005318 [Puccinia striiformis f. sp. tritici]|uniref:Uncharacterized protein n=1 Tax=Puccinia striiformis f. sp. tritici TaxID=168172 RepID=A0ACC0EJX5_9BASI|nr:hypothetical protein Pst134EB_010547 [Puccinia striiformis f. sp. tritici]KAI7954918.1 hypothetical protein MJO28_005318 [Puccinia striiformis f. sp. tritici]KAI9627068.1 hypothetical protein H4Q26_017539 [Puccinia striiformis f. sp. tritici PST-130]